MTRLLRAELLKLRTTRMALVLLLSSAAVAAINVVAQLLTAGEQPGLDLTRPDDVRALFGSLSGVSPLVLVVGVVIVTAEFRHGTITGTFLAEPRRGRVLAAKLAAGALAGLAFALVSAVITVAVTVPWLAAVHDDAAVSRLEVAGVVVGAIAALGLWGAAGVVIGALLPNQVAAIVVALVWTTLVESSLVAFVPEVGRWLPSGAAGALASVGGDEQLSAWLGGLLFAGYLFVAALVAARVFVRRDVT